MKIDFDSVIYIIISIAILALSGLSGARRRKAQQLKTNVNNPGSAPPGPSPRGTSTMDRLEQMFTGQMGFENLGQAESPDEDEIMEEEPSLEEVTPDQEKEIQSRLDDKRISPGYGAEDSDQSFEDEQKAIGKELFRDLDEIKKAVIYSEVFKRKYN